MADKKIIAVVGATGSQGGGLAQAILNDPNGGFAVRAITRDVNTDKAKALAKQGAEVVQADLARGSLYTADEVFLTGTAAEVTPVREIDGRVVGAGEPGPVTRKAQDLFSDLVAAKIPEYRHWLSFI